VKAAGSGQRHLGFNSSLKRLDCAANRQLHQPRAAALNAVMEHADALDRGGGRRRRRLGNREFGLSWLSLRGWG